MNFRLPKLYRWMHRVESWWRRRTGAPELLAATTPAVPPAPPMTSRLERIVLTEGVADTLFQDYSDHRRSARGNEEIGWTLLGVRQGDEAIALAAIPAGAARDASTVHVQFNADAQAVASRILRQKDKRLQIVGVVHTHPGNLTHPSNGDYAGDSVWVAGLRDREAVFGIGTAVADLQFSWYALAVGDAGYRPLPTRVDAGPDLAACLRPLWHSLETHAADLEKLCRLFANVQFDQADGGLAVRIGLGEPQQGLRLLLKAGDVRYYLDRGGELIAVEPRETKLDRAVFLILAELAKDQPAESRETYVTMT
ncbi:MAG TPA: Mov34/MPN/PAD-1 family protein [Gemmataceae bacterium]|nr:Mov34/MPN/PAD-1 family protein [Gemmataceae bacterium]